jgi:hypothetical protein
LPFCCDAKISMSPIVAVLWFGSFILYQGADIAPSANGCFPNLDQNGMGDELSS